jgi:hypothetical protein
MKEITHKFKKCESLADCEQTNCYECDGLISWLRPPYVSSCMDMRKQMEFRANISPVYME